MEQEIRRLLGSTAVVGRELRCFGEIGSTNACVKALALTGAPDGTVVLALGQSKGRGRLGRAFHSPRGKGLYLTALLRPALPANRLLPVTALAGVGVCNAVEELCGVRPGVKWPNDLVLGGRKLCGILTELVTAPDGELCVALGIGVNISQTHADFSSEVAEMATSLEIELGRAVSRPALAAAVIRELDRLYTALKAGELSPYLAAYRRDCVNLGKTVRLIAPDGGRETAAAVDIDGDFGLVVRDGTGRERAIRSGEVSVRGFYGYME